jgi:hypothetical protein
MRRPLVIYDFAIAPSWLFCIWGNFFLFYQCTIINDPMINSSAAPVTTEHPNYTTFAYPCFLISDDAAAGPGTLGSTAAAAAVAGQEGQAGPVSAAQNVRAGLREGYNIFFNFCTTFVFFCTASNCRMDCCNPV